MNKDIIDLILKITKGHHNPYDDDFLILNNKRLKIYLGIKGITSESAIKRFYNGRSHNFILLDLSDPLLINKIKDIIE